MLYGWCMDSHKRHFDKFLLSPYISNHFYLIFPLLLHSFLFCNKNALRNTITHMRISLFIRAHQSIRVSSSFGFKSNAQYPLSRQEGSISFVQKLSKYFQTEYEILARLVFVELYSHSSNA